MARILSISYDPSLLLTRELMLQQMGHVVVSVEGFSNARRVYERETSNFDLIVLGHSIPPKDKLEIIKCCGSLHRCPVLALLKANEPPLKGATRSVKSGDPKAFTEAIVEILQPRAT